MLETLIISDMLPLLGSTFLRFLAYFLWCCRSSFSFLVISFNSAHIAQHHYPLRRSPISFLHSLSVLCLPRFVLSSFRRRRGRRKLRPVWSWRLSQNQWAHLEAKLVVLFSSGTQTHTQKAPPTTHFLTDTLSDCLTLTFLFSLQSTVTTGLWRTKYRLPSTLLTDQLPLHKHTHTTGNTSV